MLVADTVEQDLAPAFFFLVAHSIELMLKAVCIHDGATVDEVKSFGRRGHSLHDAYVRAMNSGAVPRYLTIFGQIMLELDGYHISTAFRFPPSEEQLIVPPPDACVRELNAMLGHVGSYLEGENQEGK